MIFFSCFSCSGEAAYFCCTVWPFVSSQTFSSNIGGFRWESQARREWSGSTLKWPWGLGKRRWFPVACRLWSLPAALSLRQPGVRLHFVELGSGPVVCLCHGFPESWFSWRYQVREIGRRYTPVRWGERRWCDPALDIIKKLTPCCGASCPRMTTISLKYWGWRWLPSSELCWFLYSLCRFHKGRFPQDALCHLLGSLCSEYKNLQGLC